MRKYMLFLVFIIIISLVMTPSAFAMGFEKPDTGDDDRGGGNEEPNIDRPVYEPPFKGNNGLGNGVEPQPPKNPGNKKRGNNNNERH